MVQDACRPVPAVTHMVQDADPPTVQIAPKAARPGVIPRPSGLCGRHCNMGGGDATETAPPLSALKEILLRGHAALGSLIRNARVGGFRHLTALERHRHQFPPHGEVPWASIGMHFRWKATDEGGTCPRYTRGGGGRGRGRTAPPDEGGEGICVSSIESF